MMGQLEQAIEQAIRAQASKAGIRTVCRGIATEVTETTCTVEREGAPTLYGVLLNAVDGGLQSCMTVYPEEGSPVLVAIVENLKTEAVLIKCSGIEKVKIKAGGQTLIMDRDGFVFNGGNNRGMVKAADLVGWMTRLYNDLQALKGLLSTHPVAGNGSPLGLTFNITVPAPDIPMFENEKIKQ